MKPAARVTDMHTCPMVTGTVPHVGGPIIPPAATTVFAGGLPAARVGDRAVCAGPPDTIVKGSLGVFVQGKPFARLGDPTAHGGVIVAGCPTVLVGDIGGGGAMSVQGRTMSAARKAGAPFTKMKCDAARLPPGKAGAVKAGSDTKPRGAVAAPSPPPSYPHTVRLPGGGSVTRYSKYILLTGTPEEQANGVRQLDAIREGPGGPELLAGIESKQRITTLKVVGNAARGREVHADPPRQHYQNCSVQSSQQIIHQVTGKALTESEMETLANSPNKSGYERDWGTPVKGIKTILENGGVPAKRIGNTPENIQKALEQGRGVIAYHDAGKLWLPYDDDPNNLGKGHSVFTTAVIKDETGSALGYVFNDTGDGRVGRAMPAADYEATLIPGKHLTVTKKKIW